MKKIITNFLNDIKKEIENTKKEKSIKKQIPNLLTTSKRNIAYYYNTNPIIK